MKQLDTYHKIVLASMELFADKGYDATGVNLIAKKAMISKGGFYHHFKSKDDLLIAIIEFLLNKLLHQKLPDYARLNKKNFKKTLSNLGLNIIYTSKTDPMIKKFSIGVLSAILRKPKLMNKMLEIMELSIERIKEMLLVGVNVGAISKKTNIDLLAQKTFIMLDALEMYISMGIKLNVEAVWVDFIDQIN